MKKPNLFIVGAARSGTTYLWNNLLAHPEIFMPKSIVMKEPAYFSDIKVSRYKDFDNYMKMFQGAQDCHRWIGEASTAYLTDPGSARRIFEFNPDSKIIILLRNPADRAYSLYNWMTQSGYEYNDTFEKALLMEQDRASLLTPGYFEPEYYHNYQYFSSGLYYEQVRRFSELFHDNALVIEFEELISGNAVMEKRIGDFLDIDIDSFNSAVENPSVKSCSAKIQFILRKITQYYFLNMDKFDAADTESDFRQLILQGAEDCKRKLLKRDVSISPEESTRLNEIIDEALCDMHCKERKLDRESIASRDFLVRKGWVNLSHDKVDDKLRACLMQRYENNIEKLTNYTKMDFSCWSQD